MRTKSVSWWLYLWLIFWPWSTKLILRPAETNYLEIAWYLSSVFLIWPLAKLICDSLRSKRQKRNLNKLYPAWWWGASLLFIVAVLSVLWAVDTPLAFFRLLILSSGLGIFLLNVYHQDIDFFNALKVFLIGLVPPAIFGIWQFWTQNIVANKYLGLAAHSASELGVSVIETGAGRFLRSYGPFDHPNIFGSVMALGAITALFLFLKRKNKKPETVFLLATFLILVAAMITSFSRAAVLSFFISLVALIWTQRQVFWQRASSFIIGLIVLVALAFLAYQPLIMSRTDVTARLESRSINERLLYFQQAGDLISANIFSGVGLGGYITTLINNEGVFPVWYYQPVHNYWLLVWAELGIFGLLAILLLWFGVLEDSIKNKTWPIWLLLFILSVFDHWMWTQPVALIIIFFILGSLRLRD